MNFPQKLSLLVQVPTGGVPIVHGNPTWSDCSVWFQAGWGGNHPVHTGACSDILTLEEKVTEQTDIFTQSERLSLSHIVSSIHHPYQRQMGKRLPCPFLATSPKCTPYAADLMFCSAHQADGERGPGGGQVGSACQELLHPSGKTYSMKINFTPLARILT